MRPFLSEDHLAQLGLLTVRYQSQTGYTDKPNNALSLPRLLNREKEFYKAKDNVEVYEYKALVLTEWRPEEADSYDNLFTFLKDWISLRRPLYIFYRNKLIKIESEQELSSYLHFLIKPVPVTKIYDLMAEINIAADAVAILNTYKLQEIKALLLTKDSVEREGILAHIKDQHVIYLGDLLYNDISIDEVIPSLIEPSGYINLLSMVNFGSMKYLSDNINSIIENDVFDGICLNKYALDLFVSKLKANPKILKITTIMADNIDIEDENFLFLLEHCPQFNFLNYQADEKRYYSLPSNRLQPHIQKLKRLTLRGPNQLMAQFFEKATIEELNIQDHVNYSVANYLLGGRYTNFIKNLDVSSLKIFSWEGPQINFDFFKRAKNLTHLTIKAANYEPVTNEATSLPSLSYFLIEGKVIENDLITLLTAMENVKYLSIWNENETFDMFGENFNKEQILNHALLSRLPKKVLKLMIYMIAKEDLEEEDPDYATNIPSILTILNANSLVELETTLSGYYDFYDLQEECPQLKSLVLNHLPRTDSDDHISLEDMGLFLSRMPHLEYLEYNEVVNEWSMLGNTLPLLDALEKLKLSRLRYLYANDFSYLLLVRLLKTAPRLEAVFYSEKKEDLDILLDPIMYLNSGSNRPNRVKSLTHVSCGDELKLPHFFNYALADTICVYMDRVDDLNQANPCNVYLESCRQTINSLLPIQNTSLLKSLTLSEVNLEKNFDFNSLGAYREVTVLHLQDVKFYSSWQLVKFLNQFSQLSILTLEITIKNSKESHFHHLNLSSLRSLTLFSFKGFEKLLQAAVNIERLKINRPIFRSLPTLEKIVKTHPRLVDFAFPIEEDANLGMTQQDLRNVIPRIQLVNIPAKEKKEETGENATKYEETIEEDEGPAVYYPEEYFIPKNDGRIGPCNYRLSIHDLKKVSSSTDELILKRKKITDVKAISPALIKMLPKGADLRKKYFADYHHLPDVFYGKFKQTIYKDHWTFLPSLSPQDIVLHVKCASPLYMGFSEKTGLYAIKHAHNITDEVEIEIVIQTHFNELTIPPELKATYEFYGNQLLWHFQFTQGTELTLDSKKLDIPVLVKTIAQLVNETESRQLAKNSIAALLEKGEIHEENIIAYHALLKCFSAVLNNFGQGALSPYEKNAAGLLNAFLKDRKGACRHRSTLFHALFYALKIPGRYVDNIPHAFIEMPTGYGGWFTIDLGGYPGTIISQPTYQDSKGAYKRKLRALKNEIVADGKTAGSRFDFHREEGSYQQLEIPHVAQNGLANFRDDVDDSWDDLPDFLDEVFEEELDLGNMPNHRQDLPDSRDDLPHSQNELAPLRNDDIQIKPDNLFITWKETVDGSIQFLPYWQQLEKDIQTLKAGSQNVLITFPDTASLEKFYLSLLDLQIKRSRRAFYLSSPGEISFTEAVMEGNQNIVAPSELVDYLSAPQVNDLLLVNWSEHKPKHIGYNTIVDTDRRRLGNHSISVNTIVIVLITADKRKSLREDFYSRFRIKAKVPAAFEYPELPKCMEISPSKSKTVDLMERDDWKSHLVGTIALYNNQLSAVKGTLLEIDEQGIDSLHIHNAKEAHRGRIEFFLQELLIKRSIYFNRKPYPLPANFNFTLTTKPYSFEGDYTGHMVSVGEPLEYDWVLNKETYESFFTVYSYFNETPETIFPVAGKLTERPGRISALTRGQTVTILVTATLTDGEWSHLLAHANTCGTALKILSYIALPSAMLKHLTVLPKDEKPRIKSKVFDVNMLEPANYIVCQNMNFVVDQFSNQEELTLFTVTPQIGYEIIEYPQITPELNTNYDRGELAIALKNGKVAILKIAAGMLSPQLEEALESLFLPQPYFTLNGVKEKVTGKLIVVSETNEYFKYFPHKVEVHSPTKAALPAKVNPFAMLKEVPPEEEFIQRALIILGELVQNPCAYLKGATGAGKSSLITKTLPAYLKERLKLFVGLEKLPDWAVAKGEWVILFVDEASLLAEGALELFEDLYNQRRGIMINHRYIELSPNHKVIFAGNTIHYIGRINHAFVERHGLYLELPVLPDKALVHHFIAPSIPANNISGTVADILLQTYHFINEKTDTVLTPRNLKNMSMRFSLLMEDLANKEMYKEIAWLSCFDEIRYLVKPQTKQTFRALMSESISFEKYRAVKKQLVQLTQEKLVLADYAVTHVKQRRMIYDALRMEKSASGLLLEGMPGVGKSTLLLKFLEALKIPYLLLQASNEEEATEALVHAFHNGLVVVIDELNTMPYLEYVLNSLMMGEDLNGNTAKKDGFKGAATQNPITFGGRYPLSPALKNRFLVIQLKEYRFEELVKIAMHSGLSEQEAFCLTRDYMDALKFARSKNLKPEPTPRDFTNVLGIFTPVKNKEDEEMKEEVCEQSSKKIKVG